MLDRDALDLSLGGLGTAQMLGLVRERDESFASSKLWRLRFGA